MIERIVSILNSNPEISDWKLVHHQTEANELFMVKKKVHMPRSKNTSGFELTIYKDFEENEKKYRGSSTVKVHPTMTESEIQAAISDALLSASYVKNPYYPLPEMSYSAIRSIPSRFEEAPLSEWMSKIKEALYDKDRFDRGFINSSELFLHQINTRLMNSRGIDYSYRSYKAYVELITSWKEDHEEIELYKELSFSDFIPEELSSAVSEMLLMSKEKASAQATPNLESFTVILRDEPVAELLKYYYNQASAQYIYQQVSTAQTMESIQGDPIQGDKLNLWLDPALNNAALSSPVDEDGVILEKQEIIQGGVLMKYWGPTQYSHYLQVKPTGRINNLVFEGGSKSLEEMRSCPHLEITAFSDFMVNSMTGDFAGEIRLGWYDDGKHRIPVSGGSISGNLKNVQADMYLSKELQQCTAKDGMQTIGFKGPKAVLLHHVSVAGS